MPLCARRAPRADGKTSTWAWHLDCWNPSSCAFSECEKWRETMAYQAEISRKNPGCFLFLVDQSESMEDPLAAERLADGRPRSSRRYSTSLFIICPSVAPNRTLFTTTFMSVCWATAKTAVNQRSAVN